MANGTTKPLQVEGGWRNSSVYDKLDLPPDNIDRLDVAQWENVFLSDYHLKQAAILTGWSTPAIERLREVTKRNSLLEAYGEHIITVGLKYELAQGGKGVAQLPLKHYADALPNDRYFFDDGSFMRESKLDAGWVTAPGFFSLKTYCDPAKVPLESMGALTFSLGGDGQGIPFHFHGDTYNVLLHGRKRWAIYAPHRMTPTGFLGTESFGIWLQLRTDAPKFVQPTWEFVQQAGEVVYVPEGYFHATMCLGDAVGVVHKAVKPHPSTAWHHFVMAQRTREPKQSLSHIKLAIEADSTNADLVVERGVCHGRLKALDLLSRCMLKALQINPLHSMAHKNLILGLKFLGKDPQKAIKDAILAGIELDGPLIPGVAFSIPALDNLSLRCTPGSMGQLTEEEIQRRIIIWNDILWKSTPAMPTPLHQEWCEELGIDARC